MQHHFNYAIYFSFIFKVHACSIYFLEAVFKHINIHLRKLNDESKLHQSYSFSSKHKSIEVFTDTF